MIGRLKEYTFPIALGAFAIHHAWSGNAWMAMLFGLLSGGGFILAAFVNDEKKVNDAESSVRRLRPMPVSKPTNRPDERPE